MWKRHGVTVSELLPNQRHAIWWLTGDQDLQKDYVWCRMFLSDFFCPAVISLYSALSTLWVIQSDLGAILPYGDQNKDMCTRGISVFSVSDRQKFGAVIYCLMFSFSRIMRLKLENDWKIVNENGTILSG